MFSSLIIISAEITQQFRALSNLQKENSKWNISKNLEDVYVFKQISWNILILADKDDRKFRTDHCFSFEKKVAQFFCFQSFSDEYILEEEDDSIFSGESLFQVCSWSKIWPENIESFWQATPESPRMRLR